MPGFLWSLGKQSNIVGAQYMLVEGMYKVLWGLHEVIMERVGHWALHTAGAQ